LGRENGDVPLPQLGYAKGSIDSFPYRVGMNLAFIMNGQVQQALALTNY